MQSRSSLSRHALSPVSDTDSPTGPEALTPEQTRQIIDSQRARVDAALVVDERRLYLAWGSAWLVGFLGLWATSGSDALFPALRAGAFGVFFLLLAAASVFTAVHITRATRGVQGVSATTGLMYGWSWGVSFAALPVLIYSTERVGASVATIDLLWTTLAGDLRRLVSPGPHRLPGLPRGVAVPARGQRAFRAGGPRGGSSMIVFRPEGLQRSYFRSPAATRSRPYV